MKLELGSQISVCHPLYRHAALTEDNISHSKVSTFSSDSVSTQGLVDSSDNKNGSGQHNLNHILNSPSHSESSVRTDYASNILLDNVDVSCNSEENDTRYIDSNNFRKDTAYVQSVETETNLDLHQEPAEDMKICQDSDGYLEHGSDVDPQVCSQPASAEESASTETKAYKLGTDLDANEVKFEFGDGFDLQSVEPDFEFDPSCLTAPSNPAMLDYLLTDEFASEVSNNGYVSSVHKHFDMSPISDAIHGDADLYGDVVHKSEHTTNSFPPYVHSYNVTTHTRTASSLHNSGMSFSSGYISSDTSDFSFGKVVSYMPSNVDVFFLEEIPIYSTNH